MNVCGTTVFGTTFTSAESSGVCFELKAAPCLEETAFFAGVASNFPVHPAQRDRVVASHRIHSGFRHCKSQFIAENSPADHTHIFCFQSFIRSSEYRKNGR
jgi:hypothetical protein